MRALLQTAVLMLALTSPIHAESAFAVLPGFVADLDGVCGLGQDLDEGCDVIRARRIVDASSAPWQAIGRVNFADMVNRRHCTGTLVAPDVVLTAAHCLRNEDGAVVPVQGVTFAAGYQRGAAVSAAQARRFVFGDSAAAREPARDWALIVLDRRIAVPPAFLTSETNPGADALLLGYAGLRAHVLSEAQCGALGPVRAGLHVLQCPAMPGDSGAPIVVWENDTLRVVAVMSSLVSVAGETAALAAPVDAVRGALTDATAF